MGHKVNPIGLRVGINRTWDSRWFASRGEYGKLLHEDMHIRDHILKQRRQAGIARVVIERPHKKCRGDGAHGAAGRAGSARKAPISRALRSELAKLTCRRCISTIVEVRKPEIDATLVAETIAQQLERQVAFRRAMKRAVQSALRLGALGIRINCSGQAWRRGNCPRRVVPRGPRAAAYRCAPTLISAMGSRKRPTASLASRCWIFKGEIMDHDPMAAEKRAIEAQEAGGGTAAGAGAVAMPRAGPNGRPSSRERTERSMLQPVRTKCRKAHKGRDPWQRQGVERA